ncbi:MAG: hypothetical protein NTY48_07545 [Candidatus Diapherotrites archaeon]|nr:hypothetical protein [Candidatus Diapherotrites archaeon]
MADETNPLLEEIRNGLGAKDTQNPQIGSQEQSGKETTREGLEESKKDEIKRVLETLKKKMAEIDNILDQIKQRGLSTPSLPKRTEQILTQIKVPALEMLK